MSEYPSIIFIASLRDSPLDMEVAPGSAKLITSPPRSFIADSKLMRVLVEGSKKRVASTFPLRRSG